MVNVFIFHGTYGYPCENWFPWLKEKLEELGHIVFVPHFPAPPNHNLNNWMKVFEGYQHYIDENTIFVGHSLGCGFILDMLETLNQSIKCSFLVAGFLKKFNKPEFVELNKTFVDKDFKWNKIKQNCGKFFVFNSDDDPNVPLEKGKELAEKLNVELILVPNAGHFNTKAGYTKFDLLLEEIKEIL